MKKPPVGVIWAKAKTWAKLHPRKAAAAGIVALYIGTRFFGSSSLKVPAASVQWKNDFVLEAEGEGQIRPGREVFLTIRRAGRLDKIFRSVGDKIEANEIIAVIDETNNKASLRRALTNYKLAGLDHGRNSTLLRSRAVTRQQWDESQSRLSVTASELQEAKQRLEDSIVRSPIAGKLVSFAFKQRDFVPEGSRVAVIEEQNRYQIVTKVDASIKKILPPKAIVKVKSTAGGTSATHDVESAVTLANPTSDYEGQDLDILLEFDKIPEGLSARDAVHVTVPIKMFPRVALVGRKALTWHDDKPALLMANAKGELRWLAPEIGGIYRNSVVVTNLPEKDRVIIPDEVPKIDEVMSHRKRVTVEESPDSDNPIPKG